ncbi:leucine rich repeat protein [Leptospira noguchii str. 2001034031]|uniref:Leucine rich repeat protein n=1 Tax=Leptospira noguchii str. 2001034031 TaxID=1193053 RepID=M6YBX2_9LEPT|nr:leucine rich repeat protein [Leptospira noguchii str. 2001034031]
MGLINNQLKTLPKEIGQLENLRTLSLTYNQLKTLPKEIRQLQNLQTVFEL